MELIIGLIALLAGLEQGITGFGAGIVMMLVLPSFYALPQAAGVSTAIAVILNVMMVYTYRKYIDLKKILFPSFLYICVCTISINFSTMVDQALMKKVFGVFLVLLAVYYLFINKSGDRKKLSLSVRLVCIVVSAICDGLFGIGGPLMVLYFMSQSHSTHEYLGNISLFFMINCFYNTGLRIFKGILTPAHLLIIGIGMAGILAGGQIANKLVNKIDGNVVKKLTYVMIGMSGLINLI